MEIYRFKALFFILSMGVFLPGSQVNAMFETSDHGNISDEETTTPQVHEQESHTETQSAPLATQPESHISENQPAPTAPGILSTIKSKVSSLVSRTPKKEGSSWLGKIGDAEVTMPEKTKEDLIELITKFTDSFKEAFQGSSDLQSLQQMRDDVSTLKQEIQSFLSENFSDSDRKRAADLQQSSHQDFYIKIVLPKLQNIEKKHTELVSKIKGTQEVGNKPKNNEVIAPQALTEKENSLAKIKSILITLLPDNRPTIQGLGISSNSNEPKITINLPDIGASLFALEQEIELTSGVFKKLDTGISEAMSKHIETFTGKLNTIVGNLSAQLKSQLREVVGYSGLIKLHNKIETLLSTCAHLPDDALRSELAALKENIIGLRENLRATDIHETISQVYDALKDLFNVQAINRETLAASLLSAKKILNKTIESKGGLAAVTELMKEKLFQVTEHFADRVAQKFATNVVDRSAEKLNYAAEKSVPKMAKKVVGYGIFGALAYTSLKWLYLKDKPTSYEWGKGLGGFLGSLACIPLVDTFVNYCYPNT